MKSKTGVDTASPEPSKLAADFVADYHEFARLFDSLAKDLFQGPQLEQLSSKFFDKHKTFLREVSFTAAPVVGQLPVRIPTHSKQWREALFSGEQLKEDLDIINSPVAHDETKQDRETWSLCQILAEFYRRICQACYLRITYNKSAHDKEDERSESVHWGRRAIRYGPDNFQAVYWYMIGIGWALVGNGLSPREKTQLSALFSQAAKRCVQLEPNDPLAYHLLGRYHYNIAQLTWLERAFANNFLGCKLNSSYADAEREFRRAHELGNWLPTGLWMARVLLVQKKPIEEVKSWIEFGLSQDCGEPSTELERRELLDLRKSLSK